MDDPLETSASAEARARFRVNPKIYDVSGTDCDSFIDIEIENIEVIIEETTKIA